LPVILTLLGALSWAFGNISSRQAEASNPLHFTLWMSVVPPIPMFVMSLITEGPAAQWHSLATLGTPNGRLALGGMAYIVVFGTIVGSGIWTTLMGRNPAGVVAPFSLLVPVVGMSLAFAVLNEPLTLLEMAAAVVVISGVLLASLRPRSHAAGNFPDTHREDSALQRSAPSG
jgi:O-acetylserine/cysteine efflux transporter